MARRFLLWALLTSITGCRVVCRVVHGWCPQATLGGNINQRGFGGQHQAAECVVHCLQHPRNVRSEQWVTARHQRMQHAQRGSYVTEESRTFVWQALTRELELA
eukprot:GHVU01080700.1.p2 GENE.GHVU01080700.1~~GHVU01080700.1.p2  ORF type:complete len:104 (-),score=1.20 GHVU01080700.1:248-559(-)